MAKMIVLDEFHITLHIRSNLPKGSHTLRTLRSQRLHSLLREAIDGVFRRYASLKGVKVTLSR